MNEQIYVLTGLVVAVFLLLLVVMIVMLALVLRRLKAMELRQNALLRHEIVGICDFIAESVGDMPERLVTRLIRLDHEMTAKMRARQAAQAARQSRDAEETVPMRNSVPVQPAPPKRGGGDPLEELARLIGQTDPFSVRDAQLGVRRPFPPQGGRDD